MQLWGKKGEGAVTPCTVIEWYRIGDATYAEIRQTDPTIFIDENISLLS